jgi:two-component system chemotaxis sensor kinase CheA
MSNLLGNALKFTPDGGTIAFSGSLLSTDAAQVLPLPHYVKTQAENLFSLHKHVIRLSVRDTGNGIPQEDQESIFERFVQSRPSSREYGGVGLGLAYCKLMIMRFGGVIWVESTLGQGSEFIILLPCLETPRNT